MLHFLVTDVIENVSNSFFIYVILSLYFGMLVTLASFSLLYFSSNQHTVYIIQLTAKLTARGLILPSSCNVIHFI